MAHTSRQLRWKIKEFQILNWVLASQHWGPHHCKVQTKRGWCHVEIPALLTALTNLMFRFLSALTVAGNLRNLYFFLDLRPPANELQTVSLMELNIMKFPFVLTFTITIFTWQNEMFVFWCYLTEKHYDPNLHPNVTLLCLMTFQIHQGHPHYCGLEYIFSNKYKHEGGLFWFAFIYCSRIMSNIIVKC